jgi:hypothetical protein
MRSQDCIKGKLFSPVCTRHSRSVIGHLAPMKIIASLIVVAAVGAGVNALTLQQDALQPQTLRLSEGLAPAQLVGGGGINLCTEPNYKGQCVHAFPDVDTCYVRLPQIEHYMT